MTEGLLSAVILKFGKDSGNAKDGAIRLCERIGCNPHQLIPLFNSTHKQTWEVVLDICAQSTLAHTAPTEIDQIMLTQLQRESEEIAD